MKLGCGYPMGPFTLLDLVGLDTTLYVAEVMFEEFREPRYAPPPLLRRMVMAGHLGRKSGKGFYDFPTPLYSPPFSSPPLRRRRIDAQYTGARFPTPRVFFPPAAAFPPPLAPPPEGHIPPVRRVYSIE